MKRRQVFRQAALLTLVAAVLRFFKLGHWGLWIDEGNTLYLTEHLSGNKATDAYPLFFWMERGMVELFGTGEFALRLLPALLGILSVTLTYLLFRRCAGERAAFWAALLLALSPWHIFWSQNARYYTLLVVEALLLFRLAWDWWEEGGEIRLGGVVLVALAGLMSQFTMILAWPALVAYPLLARVSGYAGDRRFAWRRIFIFTAALIIPIALSFGRIMAFGGQFGSIPRYYGDNPLLLLAALAIRVGLPVGLVMLMGIFAGLKTKDRVQRRFTLFLIAAVMVTTLLATVGTLRVIVTSYYIFFALPFFILLAGIALEETWESKRLTLVAGIALAAFYLQGDLLYFTAHHGDRIRWKESTEYVVAHRQPGDAIFSSGTEAVSYYLGEQPALLNGTKLHKSINWTIEDEIMQPTGRTWYIINDTVLEEMDGDGKLAAFLGSRCRQKAEYPLWNTGKNRTVRVYLYDPVGG